MAVIFITFTRMLKPWALVCNYPPKACFCGSIFDGNLLGWVKPIAVLRGIDKGFLKT